MNFQQAEKFLNSLMMFGIKLGLEQVRELLDRVGAPDRQLRFIHLAGSNGKGSTAVMLMAALRKAGFKTGFYSSPHLISPRERFRINGQAVSEDIFAALVEAIRPAVEEMKDAGRCPTYFEATTAMAALCFAQEQTDFVIWETGMGGRFDATNVVDPVCSIITGISLEHQEYLGDTIAKVAFEKAGIIKPERPVFINRMAEEAERTIREVAAATGAPLKQVPDECFNFTANDFDPDRFVQSFQAGPYRLELGLAGDIQRKNAVLAVTVLEYLASKFEFDLDIALSGFADARWPGRFQKLPDGSLLDGAHNPEGAEILAMALRKYFPGEKFTFVFGNFADKDTEAILKILYPLAQKFIFVPIQAPRECCSPEQLCEIAGRLGTVPAMGIDNVDEALKCAFDGKRVIAGSLYLAGEALQHFFKSDQILNI